MKSFLLQLVAVYLGMALSGVTLAFLWFVVLPQIMGELL